MRKSLKKFGKDTSGVALVEFAIFLPIFVLSLAVIVESARIFFSYQGAVVGVRDATRYLARTLPGDICSLWGTSGFVALEDGAINASIVAIIDEAMDNEDDLLPANVSRGTVSATWVCEDPPIGQEYRQTQVPIARIAAQFTIQLPLGDVFELNGFTVPPITHVVIDESRIFGV